MENSEISDAGSLTKEIIHAARCIRDPKLRVNYLGEKILALNDSDTVMVITLIFDLALSGDEEAKDAWAMLINPETFVEKLDRFRRSRIYHQSVRQDNKAIQVLFSRGRPARTSDKSAQQFLVHGMADHTLGERLSLARKTDNRTRAKIAYDVDPRVIIHLLENPRTTESDVVMIAARRPLEASILETIFRNPKWITRYMVKVAIARNPYTPSNISQSILPEILLKDLIEIRDDKALHADVRESARFLIVEKRKLSRKRSEEITN